MVAGSTIAAVNLAMARIALNTIGGGIAGATLMGIGGGYVGYKLGESTDPCKDGQMLTTLGGVLIGASYGLQVGAALGLSGFNLLTTPFKTVVSGIASIVGDSGISGYVAAGTSNIGHAVAAGATSLGHAAATVAKAAIATNHVAIGVTVTAAILGAVAYSLYKRTTPEQIERAYNTAKRVFNFSLQRAENLLDKRFEAFENALAKFPFAADLQKLNDKLITEYAKHKDISIDTVREVRNAYQDKFKTMNNEQLKEIQKISDALIKSIGECHRLREPATQARSL